MPEENQIEIQPENISKNQESEHSRKALFNEEKDISMEKPAAKIPKRMKDQDKRIQQLIERENWKGDNEVTQLGLELFDIPMDNDEFEPMLPELFKESVSKPKPELKTKTDNSNWNDVNSEDLMNVYDSFTEDPELRNDPNLPVLGPPLDSGEQFFLIVE